MHVCVSPCSVTNLSSLHTRRQLPDVRLRQRFRSLRSATRERRSTIANSGTTAELLAYALIIAGNTKMMPSVRHLIWIYMEEEGGGSGSFHWKNIVLHRLLHLWTISRTHSGYRDVCSDNKSTFLPRSSPVHTMITVIGCSFHLNKTENVISVWWQRSSDWKFFLLFKSQIIFCFSLSLFYTAVINLT